MAGLLAVPEYHVLLNNVDTLIKWCHILGEGGHMGHGGARKGAGRKHSVPDELRSETIKFRATANEKAEIEAAAAARGLRVSAWLRLRVLANNPFLGLGPGEAVSE